MIDSVDKSILRLLQRNAKITVKEMTERLSLTATPIHERIKKLEKLGYIDGYKASLNRSSLGLNLVVYCSISLKDQQTENLEQFEKDVHKFSEIVEVYHIAGSFDYLLKVMVLDMEMYHEFVSKRLASLENIARVQSSFVMTEVKPFGGIPVE